MYLLCVRSSRLRCDVGVILVGIVTPGSGMHLIHLFIHFGRATRRVDGPNSPSRRKYIRGF